MNSRVSKLEGKLFSGEMLRALVLPLMAEQVLALLIGLVDTLMVSRAGDAAISGVALVDNINRLIIQVLAALATGGAVICSQYLGRGEEEEARKANAQLHMVMSLVAVVVVAISMLFTRDILSAIFGNVDADVMDSAVLYFVVTALSYPFLAVYNAGAATFRAMGNSKISMDISIIMNVINVVANGIFVFGFGMDVMGVALATVLSRVAAGLVMLYYTTRKSNPLCFKKARDFHPNASIIKKILKIGIPSGIENGVFQIGKLMVVGMVTTFGTASIAANSVGYTIIDFINIPGVAIGLALITVVGRCLGAGEKEQAKFYVKYMLKYAYLGGWICDLLLFISAGYLVTFFHLSPEAVVIATQVLRAFALAALPIWPLSFSLPSALRASGDVTFTMVVSIGSMWIFRVGSSYLLGVVLGMGVMGVWCGMFIDWFARSICFTIRFLSGKWLEKRVI